MSKRTKKDKRPVAKIDFKPYGAAIKAGRTKQKESRNKAADALFISPRYLANIENKGQHPSVQVFLELMSRYHISVDQILHGEAMEGKSTERMQFETLLDELTDAEIKILTPFIAISSKIVYNSKEVIKCSAIWILSEKFFLPSKKNMSILGSQGAMFKLMATT